MAFFGREHTTIKENILVYFYWSGVMRRFVYVHVVKWVCRWCHVDKTNDPIFNEQRFHNLSGGDSCVGSKKIENGKCQACDDTRSRDRFRTTKLSQNLKKLSNSGIPCRFNNLKNIALPLNPWKYILAKFRRCQSWKLSFYLINFQKVAKKVYLLKNFLSTHEPAEEISQILNLAHGSSKETLAYSSRLW